MKQTMEKKNMTRRAAVLLFGAVLSCLAACTHPSGLERTWERAGKNRAELEKVLRHYGDDSRKHRAALFLLEQMADCYSWSGTNIDTLKRLKQLSGLPGKEAWTDSVKKAWNFPQLLSCTKVYDAQVITADFLIRHIDHAFAIWDSRPWSKYYPLEEFIRHVLPYRLGDEPLEDWRESYYMHFANRVDSIYSGGDVIRKTQAVETIINRDGFQWNELFPSLPHLGAGYLFRHRLGSCRESCDFTLYLLRALGIPSVTDHYIVSPHTSGMHWWNAVRDTTGSLVPFWLEESKVGREMDDGRPKGKVFRLEFGGRTCDVTSEYFGRNVARVRIGSDIRASRILLCVFSCGRLVPVGQGEVHRGEVAFHDLEPGIRFFPMYQHQSGDLRFAGHPFCVDSLGSTVFYVPDKWNRTRALLRRKYAFHHHLKERGLRMAGNRVTGSSRRDFRFPDTLFTFPRTLKTNRHVMVSASNRPVRYLRWDAIPSRFNVSVAEIAFHEYGTGRKLPFRLLDLPSPVYGHGVSNMTDGDVLTTYQAKEHGPQTQVFDLGGIYRLSDMLYIPHNDGNYIEPGDTYELFYQNGSEGWKSLGRKTADADSLVYEGVPGNAVFWLRDLTKGREEQQFVLDGQGEQSFH